MGYSPLFEYMCISEFLDVITSNLFSLVLISELNVEPLSGYLCNNVKSKSIPYHVPCTRLQNGRIFHKFALREGRKMCAFFIG